MTIVGVFTESATYTLTQYGFRFRNDDGDETDPTTGSHTGATWIADQNVNP